MPEHLVNIRITQPGRVTGAYRLDSQDALYLERVEYPEQELPFDVGVLPRCLTPFGEPIPVLLIGSLSHPMNTVLEARLVGALCREDATFLLAVSTADERATVSDTTHLPHHLHEELYRTVQGIRPGNWRWATVTELEPLLHEGSLRYRKAAATSGRMEYEPEWKPLHLKRLSPGFAEADMYTAAEYTFQELPYHFQHYVSEHLAPDERVLYAVRRPSILSHKKHGLRRERLQAGVLILTTQRLIQLVELMPPDSANIRYGFHSTVGVLERFAGVQVEQINDEAVVLRTQWLAAGGHTSLEWEAPVFNLSAIKELSEFLRAFHVEPNDFALRRAGCVKVPEQLPALEDIAAGDSKALASINEQFSAKLMQSLATGEDARAWALLPEWLDRKRGAEALVVTGNRVFLLPEGRVDIPLAHLASVELTSSILQSAIVLDYFEGTEPRRQRLNFPYPAQTAFRNCFEAIRRGMAVVPLVDGA